MNREDFVVTLFAEANPVPDPSAITLVDDGGLLAPTVAELSEKTPSVRVDALDKLPGRWRPGGLVTALGTAALLAVAVFAGALLLNRTDIAADNLATIEAYHDALLAGDWRAIQAAYSEDAAYDWVTPESADGGPGLFSEPNARFPVIFPYSDWDGDGTITNLDALTSNEMMQYVNGRTELGDCVVDEGDRVICDQPSARGIFWTDGNELYSGTWTYTIEDGVITHVAFEIVRGSSGLARARAAEFEMWLDDNRPELGDTLFIPFTDRGSAWIGPDTYELFREVVSEWDAQS